MRVFLLVKFLMLFAACFAEDSSEEDDNNPLKENKALLEFVRLVEKHNMNVTIMGIYTQTEGIYKNTYTLSATMPLEDSVTQSNLTNEELSQFVEIANKEDLESSARYFHENYNSFSIASLHEDSDISLNYKLLTETPNGKKGLNYENRNLSTMKTYKVVGNDGKNETVRVVYNQFPVEVVRKSDKIKPEVVDFLKKTIPKVEMLFEKPIDAAPALSQALSEEFPERKWQCLVDPGHFYLDNDYWVSLKSINEFIVFGLEQSS